MASTPPKFDLKAAIDLLNSSAGAELADAGQVEDDPLIQFAPGDWPDATKTLRSEALDNFIRETDPTTIISRQRLLLDAGFYGRNATDEDVLWGQKDPATIGAWLNALNYGADMTKGGAKEGLLTLLAGLASQRRRQGGGAGGGDRAPLVVRLSDRADIEAVAKRAGQELIGREPDAEVVERIVSSVHALETQRQTQAYGAMESGGTITDPSVSGAAVSEMVEGQLDPTEVGVYGTTNRAQEFFNLIESTANRG